MADADSIGEVRTCKKCGETKPLDSFHKHPTCVGGRLHKCKSCAVKDSVERARDCQKTKDRKSRWAKNKRLSDPDYLARHKENGRRYFSRPEVKEKMRLRSAEKRAEDPDAYLAWRRKYRRESATPEEAINSRIRSVLTYSIRRAGGNKAGRKSFDILGYSRVELMAHLERQFLKGMSWKNMGEWHIDHIVPLSSFNFFSDQDLDFKRAWSLSNLRPLWANDNMKKHAKAEFLI